MMGCCLSIRNQRPQLESMTPSAQTQNVQAFSETHLECEEQKQENEEAPGPGDQLHDVPSSPGSVMHVQVDEDEEIVITSIQAKDVARGPMRISGGFYTLVHHSGLEWRTENKPVPVNQNVVEWDGHIPVPSDLSTNVCLGIYASFEFQPMLGNGEQLRKLTITVEQLLSHSVKDLPFTFADDEDDVSPCSSLSVTVRRQKHESGGSSASKVLDPHCPATESLVQLEDATNQGHSALWCYRKHGEIRDLERSIEQFERALNICPLDHLGRAAAQANMAMARFIHCWVDDTDRSFDVPVTLYRNALSARPVGHLDRASTLIQLAAVHSARFERRRDGVDAEQAEALLHEAMDLSSVDSLEKRAATSMLQLYARRKMNVAQAERQSSMQQDSASGSTDEDTRASGVQLLHRYERSGDLDDLQQAISVLEASIKSTFVRDHWYPVGLVNLGVALSYRFHHVGELGDLERAILSFGDAVDLTPDGHTNKPSCLNNLATSFRVRFLRHGDLSDLEQAISRYREAVELTPDGHPGRPSCLGNLGNSLLSRFQRLGELSDLEQAISRQGEAVDLIPDGHPNKPDYLNNLSNMFLTRFEHLEELSDLEEAISRIRDVVDLTPDDHPDKPGRLNNLGNTLTSRFECFGELSDLEQAISRHKDAVDLVSNGHPNKAGYLNNLGNALRTRFEHLGELSDLEQAIARNWDAVGLTPDDDFYKPCYLNNLGTSLFFRFERLGELSDLEQAILRRRNAVDLTPDGHPQKPRRLDNLGASFLTRFLRHGDLSDLEQAISRHREAVELTSDGHSGRPSCLGNLGNSLFTRFERLGELSDLEQAISRQGEAVDLTPDGHPNKPRYLSNLSTSLLIRFERLGESSDLKEASLRIRGAVNLTPDGHPDKPGQLNNLGNTIRARFERLGELSDLEQAVSRYRDAVDLTPDGHPAKPCRLDNLGNAFLTRFERLGELSDLEEAIARHGDAVDLTRDGHPNKPSHLSNLGNSFVARFERLGEFSDLEHAILRHGNAVDLTPDGHPSKPDYLSNLGTSLLNRFERLWEPNDLERAISMYRGAVGLTPDGHSSKPTYLNHLGNSLLIHFRCIGELSDLEEVISRYRDALDLTPDGHPSKPGYLNNLGNSLLVRFKRFERPSDLEQAISKYKEAIDLTPDGHPDRPARLSNLGNAFLACFERLGQLSDLQRAISRNKDAVDLTPDGHPNKPLYLSYLGNALVARSKHLGEPNDLEHAISLYSCAACTSTGPTTTRFRASQKWISCARASGHHSLLRAYSVAIAFLPQLAWIGLALPHRYRELRQGADVVREAAAAALDSGAPETAVEWLEQGRSIVWGDFFQLRSSYNELSAVHPDHARRLRRLSAALEHASTTHEKSLSSLPEQSQSAQRSTTESLPQLADRHRTLAIERDKLLQEIRGFPGFERFLLHKEFSQLRASAHSGPVAILNAGESRCDALIVLADLEHVIHVPLPSFTLGRSKGLQNAVKSLLGDMRVIPYDEREGNRDQRRDVNWESILSVLWNGAVKPVLDALHFSTPGDLSRIFWCPTGPFAFLPIHAAGLYGTRSSEPGHKVSDFVVSSYVPTLSILASSPESDATSSCHLRFLAVRQPPSDGQSPLPGVDAELEYIRATIQNSPSTRTTLLESSVGTVEEVLELMKGSDWVHFACHGIQDSARPTISGLCLADRRRLKLSDIIALSRPRGGLAFLSACQTAMGHEDLSDEAIHITAGMLFAGYGGVVGTMWSISDRLAPLVAKEVYEQLFRYGARPDYREAARALHDAVGRLRDSRASFDEWLPFIHVGL